MRIKGVVTLIFISIHLILCSQQYLTVDLSDEIRPVTHCASGSLYGMTETLPVDIESLVAPLKPHMFCQPPKGEPGRQHPFGSAIAVSERLVNTTGAVQITLADLLPSWPYKWPGKDTWLAMVRDVINEKIASGRNNYHSYTIWNEPGITWVEGNGNFYTECWKPTYELIRSLDPTAKIVGPGAAYYSNSFATEFLTYCKSNNCLPDMYSWHQAGVSNFVGWYQSYRKVEAELGIAPLDVCINEYSSRVNDQYEGCPGFAVPLIAKFERYGVESACISWWHTAYPGRLGSLLTPSNEKGGGWYLYKWYGDMSGKMVRITPPNDYSDGIDGFGCIDHQQNFASICIGGNYTGEVNVDISGIPASFGSEVIVALDYVTWENKDKPVYGTNHISTSQYSVSNSSISVSVNVASSLYAYRIHITPVKKVVVPTVEIQTPAEGAVFTSPATILLQATANDEDGTVSSVEFFNDTSSLFIDNSAPYEYNWQDVPEGVYEIKAVVTDNDGNSSEDVVTVRINMPQGPYGGLPSQIPGTVQMEYYDVGGNGFAYSDNTPDNIGGSTYRTNEDVDIENCTDVNMGYNLGYATAGEWLEYTVNVASAGKYNVILRVACNGDNRKVFLSMDGNDIASDIVIPNTGGWQAWVDVEIKDVQLEEGEHILRVTIGEIDYVNLNYIIFDAVPDPPVLVEMKKGWNFVGCPISGSTDIDVALKSIWPNVEIVKSLDDFYIKGYPPVFNLLTSLKWAKGYYIKVSADCQLDWMMK